MAACNQTQGFDTTSRTRRLTAWAGAFESVFDVAEQIAGDFERRAGRRDDRDPTQRIDRVRGDRRDREPRHFSAS